MDSLVGWVETFCVDTHRSGYQFRLMGIASLNPSYISTEAAIQWTVEANPATGYREDQEAEKLNTGLKVA
jgi:pullulanase/glycogen debranching enzyme